tara:strand:+ start:121 stop:360 length:240 start_codon:yes stop_codon:yes gene_type:complete
MQINRSTSNLITAYEVNNNCEVFNYYLARKFKISIVSKSFKRLCISWKLYHNQNKNKLNIIFIIDNFLKSKKGVKWEIK